MSSHDIWHEPGSNTPSTVTTESSFLKHQFLSVLPECSCSISQHKLEMCRGRCRACRQNRAWRGNEKQPLGCTSSTRVFQRTETSRYLSMTPDHLPKVSSKETTTALSFPLPQLLLLEFSSPTHFHCPSPARPRRPQPSSKSI